MSSDPSFNSTPPDPTSANANPIIGNCLQCQGMVRVPMASPDSEVRCPHCSHRFKLLEILEQAVPELEVIEPEEASAIDDEALPKIETFVVPSQLAQGAKRRRKRRSSSRSKDLEHPQISIANPEQDSDPESGEQSLAETASISIRENDESLSESPAHSNRPSRRERDRERKRTRKSKRRAPPVKSNPTFEFIKIVVGAALAIPIAYLLVFWVFQQDPLNIGPTISQTVPFLVPEKFRAEPEEANSSATETGNSNAGSSASESGDERSPDAAKGELAVPNKQNLDQLGR
ncbi:MAG: hypothetical protein AAFN77_06085 [Planctomycetota bacterium]